MTTLESREKVRGATEKEPRAKPTFFSAIRGIWLFTWRTQLTWRRWPMNLAIVLVLPGLIYITTASQRAWAQRRIPLGNPSMDAHEFVQRSSRSDTRLEPEQKQQLFRIFSEEYARAEREGAEALSVQGTSEQRAELLRQCYERIRERMRGVLNEGQFEQFKVFERRRVQQNVTVPVASWTRTAPFYHWLIDFYFFVIMPLVCAGASGSLIREELQADTLGFLTTRPITRARLLVVKYLCQTAWLQCVFLTEALLLFATGSLRDVPALWKLLLLFVPVQCLAVFAWSALGTFLGLITKRFMALALIYGFIVEMGIGRIPTNINTLSVIRNLKTLLSHNAALQSAYQWPAASVAVSMCAIVIAAVVFVSLAALLFTYKEYHHTAEMQK